jgi:hypothetical protein
VKAVRTAVNYVLALVIVTVWMIKMNERIRELAEQAGFSLLDIRDAFDYNEDNPYREFARLIAQDCISKIALIGISNYESNDIMWAIEFATEIISARYGVINV